MDKKELRHWRITMGMDQTQMAKFLGYSVSGYRKLEQGENKISAQLLRTIEIIKIVQMLSPEIADALRVD